MEKKLILIAEDDENLREILRIKLESQGYEVVTASNGREALEKLHSLERKPDLIILDVMMPDMDGIDVAFTISEEQKYKNIPFIFLTGLGEDIHPEGKSIDEKFAKEIGAAKFIRKGEDFDVVIGTIKELIG